MPDDGVAVSLNLSFAGISPNGTWKLKFVDAAKLDIGSVSQASLTVTTSSPGKAVINLDNNGHMEVVLGEADSKANYDLQRSTDLQIWTLLQSKTTNAIGAASHTDAAPPVPKGFYRYIPRPKGKGERAHGSLFQQLSSAQQFQ
jgi:hypothetical protein